ncbi:MAG: glycosyltransferase family 2 protein [Bacteroidales bacterium]|nr:glycosyltransferase family 2 protein [Bacteroidales bacterium]
MKQDKSLTVVMPAFNEKANLVIIVPKLLAKCKEKGWKLILVNDGSTDGTLEEMQKFEDNNLFTIVNNKINRGYGAAIKTGIETCSTEYLITVDADGQHRIEDIEKLYNKMLETDADLIVGSRKGNQKSGNFKSLGKWFIRMLAKALMPVPIHDLNSGMKIYRTNLAKKYIGLTPDTMAFSEIITLIFISYRHYVLEELIVVEERISGKSTIRLQTAFQTFMEIINIVILFNPAKIFLPISGICIIIGLIIGIPIIIAGSGVSTGSLLAFFSGILFFLLGLIAEQLSMIRKSRNQ